MASEFADFAAGQGEKLEPTLISRRADGEVATATTQHRPDDGRELELEIAQYRAIGKPDDADELLGIHRVGAGVVRGNTGMGDLAGDERTARWTGGEGGLEKLAGSINIERKRAEEWALFVRSPVLQGVLVREPDALKG
jgi:hypothetical protein